MSAIKNPSGSELIGLYDKFPLETRCVMEKLHVSTRMRLEGGLYVLIQAYMCYVRICGSKVFVSRNCLSWVGSVRACQSNTPIS